MLYAVYDKPMDFVDHEESQNDLLELFVALGVEINETGGRHGDALQAAAYNGNTKGIIRLFEIGARFHTGLGYFGSALHAAATNGHPDAACTILGSGVNVDTVCGPFGTAFQAAACLGRLPLRARFAYQEVHGYNHRRKLPNYRKTVQVLLEANADITCTGGFFGHALQAAAFAADVEIFELISRKQNKMEENIGFYGSCLQAAASGEFTKREAAVGDDAVISPDSSVVYPDEEISNLDWTDPIDSRAEFSDKLLTKNQNVNKAGGFFGRSLQAAVLHDNPTFVLKLLNAGAEVVEDGGGHYGGCTSAAISSEKRSKCLQ